MQVIITVIQTCYFSSADMGQSQSFDEPVASLGNMQAILRQQALAIKRAATITYEQFEASIVDLNKVYVKNCNTSCCTGIYAYVSIPHGIFLR